MLQEFPTEQQQFDLILCRYTMCLYFSAQELWQTVSVMATKLAPGGPPRHASGTSTRLARPGGEPLFLAFFLSF